MVSQRYIIANQRVIINTLVLAPLGLDRGVIFLRYDVKRLLIFLITLNDA